jgi:hypothetical protein
VEFAAAEVTVASILLVGVVLFFSSVRRPLRSDSSRVAIDTNAIHPCGSRPVWRGKSPSHHATIFLGALTHRADFWDSTFGNPLKWFDRADCPLISRM